MSIVLEEPKCDWKYPVLLYDILYVFTGLQEKALIADWYARASRLPLAPKLAWRVVIV